MAADLAGRHFSPWVKQQRAGNHEEHGHRPARQRNLQHGLHAKEPRVRGGQPRGKLRHAHGVQRDDGEGAKHPRPLKPVDFPAFRQAIPRCVTCLAGEKDGYSALWAARNFSTSANVGIAACAPTLVTQSAAAAEAYTMLSRRSPPKAMCAASSPT